MRKEISQTDLAAIPVFIRIDILTLQYYTCSESMKEKSEWTKMILQPIKHALKLSEFVFEGTYWNDDFTELPILSN